MKTPTKHTTRSLAASLVSITALATVQTAQAATPTPIYYKGGPGSESSPINFLLKDYWTGSSSYSGGSIPQYPEGQYDMNFGFANGANNTAYVFSSKSGTETKKCANYMKFHTGHFIFTSGNFECGNTFYLGETANASATVTKKAGFWTLDNNASVGHAGSGTLVQDGGSIWVKSSLYVGNPGTGVLTVNDGTLTVGAGTYFGVGMGTINLNGGTFKTKSIAINGQSAASASLLLNGGTIQVFGTVGSSLINSAVDVRVGANGGTINTDAQTFSIPAAINSVENTAGAFSVTGGGEVTFTAMGDFAGSFSVGDDTTLRWFDQDGAVSTTCAFSSLALGAGSTIYLDADATGHDALPATVTTTATADNPAMVKLIVRAMPAAGQAFPLFEMAESDMNKVNVVAETPAGTSLTVEKGYANGCLTYVIMAKNYVWNASQPNWGDTGAWDVNNVAADWEDNNNAVFNTADAEASLAADVMAIKLDFRADATVAAGGGTLTVPEVMVASGVSAAINASTDGALVKTGEGTLALSQNRNTAATTLSEGTLALASTASLDWSKFTFGTDPAKPVTLAFGAEATLSPVQNTWYVGNIANITSTVYKTGGDWSLGELTVGRASGAVTEFYHSGGSMSLNTLIIGYEAGSHGTLEVGDGGTVTVDNGLIFNYGSANCTGVVNLKSGGVLMASSVWRNKTGSATFNFDGGTFKESLGDANIFSANSANTAIDVSVSENGGTIDNNGFAITIPRTITGAGGLTFTGTGTTRVFADQSYLGTTTVSNGTTLSVTTVTFAGPVSFAAGSTLNVASYTVGVVSLSASALTLPAEGTVGLTLNGGAFPVGVYAICSATGVTAADGAKFAPSTGGETASWKVVGNRLILTVGTVADNYWTGLARDGDKMSTPGNWAGGTAPADGEDVDFSSVTVTTRINADIANVTFGAVTMGSGPVTFTNDNMTAKSFSDMEKVAVAANSMVTLDGDLVFGTNVESHVCRYVFEDGKFVVTGDIIATPEQTGNLYPCENAPGWISAKGLVNNAAANNFYLVQAQNWQANWMIGEDGISGSRRFFVGSSGKGTATIKATADFSVSAGIIQYNNLVLEPDGHVITLGTNVTDFPGGIYGGGANGLTTVTGPGKVVVNYNVTDLTSNANSRKNAFTVADGGTLAIVPGANPSVSTDNNGTLTVNSGATLEVAESGTVTLGSNLTFKDSAVLAFNYTTRDKPVLDLTNKTVKFDEGETTNVVAKVSAKVGVWPKGGANVLTSGGKFAGVNVSLASGSPKWVKGVSVNDDGNIVLDVKPAGLMVIFR